MSFSPLWEINLYWLPGEPVMSFLKTVAIQDNAESPQNPHPSASRPPARLSLSRPLKARSKWDPWGDALHSKMSPREFLGSRFRDGDLPAGSFRGHAIRIENCWLQKRKEVWAQGKVGLPFSPNTGLTASPKGALQLGWLFRIVMG